LLADKGHRNRQGKPIKSNEKGNFVKALQELLIPIRLKNNVQDIQNNQDKDLGYD